MKKKFLLLNILILTLVFSSCIIGNDDYTTMTFTNNSSTEVVSSIEIYTYVGVNTKSAIIVDSLEASQTLSLNDKVTYNLPKLAPTSSMRIKVWFADDTDYEPIYIEYGENDFSLTYNGSDGSPVFTISGDGASEAL